MSLFLQTGTDLSYAELSLSFLTHLSMKPVTAKLVSSLVSERLTLGVSVLYSHHITGVVPPTPGATGNNCQVINELLYACSYILQ